MLGLADFLTPAFLIRATNTTIRIFLILVAAILIHRLLGHMIDRFFATKAGLKSFQVEEKRAKTLTELLKTVIRYTIYFIALVLVLSEFHVDTTSLVAGAGVVGLALGVGAQSLIKDFISGFFIILEDQYAMGDYIVTADLAGTVEEVGFRVTKLRDSSGVLHIVPNGSIIKVSNHTRGPMQAVVNVPIAYDTDMDQVLALLEQACVAVKDMPEVVEAPKVIGLVDFRSTEIVARIVAKAVPLERVKVETALRYHINKLFAAAKIPGPVPPREEVKT